MTVTFDSLTKDQIDFLRRYEGRTRKEALSDFNETFGVAIPLNTLKGWMQKLNIKASGNGRFDGTQRPWAKGLKGEAFWDRYSEESKRRMLDAPKEANRTAKIGDVHIKAGVPYITVSLEYDKPFDERRQPLRRAVWEKHYGEIPSDQMIIHLNGNQLDCRIDNLAMIPKKYRPTILKYMKSDNPEINKATIRYCELMALIAEKKGKINGREKDVHESDY